MNKEEIYPYIEKISQSPQFIKSPTNQALLKFLVESTLTNSIPKEYIIAKEVFGKDANDNFNVRVYISNLRKKLVEYYQNEGINDEIQIRLPQGQYSVEFIKSSPSQVRKLSRKKKFNQLIKNRWFFFALGILISIFLFQINLSVKHSENLQNTKLWGGYLNSEKPTYIVLGDHYFFTKQMVPKETAFCRLPFINSDQDLDEFTSEFPEFENQFGKNERTYLSPQSTSCLHTVLPVFCEAGIKTDLRLCSTLAWDDLPDHNFLYMGSYRAINIFENFLKKAGLHFDNIESILTYTTKNTSYDFQLGGNDLLQDDYVSILRLSTGKGKEVMFLLSSYEIGNDAIAKYLIEYEQLKELEKKIPNSKCFKALFKVSGLYTTTFKSELIHIDPIDDKELIAWP